MKLNTRQFVLPMAVSACLMAVSPSWAVEEETHSGENLPAYLPPTYADAKRLVADHLPLTPTEAEQFWPVYERLEQDMNLLAERRKRLMGKFGEHFEAMSEPMAKEIIKEYLDFQESQFKLMQTYLPKFEKILPAKKLLRFYQIELKMRAAVESEIAEHVPLLQ